MGNVIRTGFENVDNLLDGGGFKKGKVSLICSRSGIGKSTIDELEIEESILNNLENIIYYIMIIKIMILWWK